MIDGYGTADTLLSIGTARKLRDGAFDDTIAALRTLHASLRAGNNGQRRCQVRVYGGQDTGCQDEVLEVLHELETILQRHGLLPLPETRASQRRLEVSSLFELLKLVRAMREALLSEQESRMWLHEKCIGWLSTFDSMLRRIQEALGYFYPDLGLEFPFHMKQLGEPLFVNGRLRLFDASAVVV